MQALNPVPDVVQQLVEPFFRDDLHGRVQDELRVGDDVVVELRDGVSVERWGWLLCRGHG